MKKATVLAIALTVLGLVSVEAKAQSSNSPSTQQPPAAEQVRQATGKQQIPQEELPDGIKKALRSDVLTVWQVSEVYKVASGAEATYEVYFINAEQKRAIARFDGEGNSVGLKNNITLTNTTHN
ncbi:hypothetical protein GCM10023188_00540 [Pontibacter saemangeumensis]|uniref:PepSY domain-containing protein n=1 Tax=Pontibacter saemangeumensis TaxID=1084525 RepID=A0ABP8L4K7_9BACT